MSLMTIAAVLATAANPGASANNFHLIANTILVGSQTELAPVSYTMSAMLLASQARDPLFPGALDLNGIDSVTELMGIVAAMNDGDRIVLLQATLNALDERLKYATGQTRRWLERKKKIVQVALRMLGR